jgi:hypothetical protein
MLMRSRLLASLAAIGLGAILSGCAHSAGDLGRISPGMSKSQVLTYLGEPTWAAGQTASTGSTSAIEEVLRYDLLVQDSERSELVKKPFYVRLVNGSVDSYGSEEQMAPTKKPAK